MAGKKGMKHRISPNNMAFITRRMNEDDGLIRHKMALFGLEAFLQVVLHRRSTFKVCESLIKLRNHYVTKDYEKHTPTFSPTIYEAPFSRGKTVHRKHQ